MSILSAGRQAGPASISPRKHTHIFTPVPILYLPEPAGEAAAKDTGVSATSPGSIVHQAASVMGSSL